MQVHLVERIPFFDALYFVTTTLTTVGYGDVVAVSLLGKAAVLAMILVGVVLIPVQTSQLYSQLTARRLTLGTNIQVAEGSTDGMLEGNMQNSRVELHVLMRPYLVDMWARKWQCHMCCREHAGRKAEHDIGGNSADGGSRLLRFLL